ncbi:MAG: dihydrofolate reductase family protein [Actinomycetales bacterium]|nr:dihydrofolate reductase family protein [Actinomycetales bacterium]
MGKLIVTEFMTLDGVAQAPGEPEEDTESGFTHGGWQAPYADSESGQAVFDQAKAMDALLLGRKTYDIFAGYWPHQPDSNPFAGLLNGVPKYVVSRTLTEPLTWEGTSLVEGDLAAGISALKERHERTHVIGSLDLLQSLLQHDLVDQLHVLVYPLLLGTGKRVFADGPVPAALSLVQSRIYPNGTVQLTYDKAGKPTYGSMG